MKNIGVIFGGNSPEYKVSLESVSSILKEIDRNKYNPIMIGITQEGTWYLYRGSISNIEKDTWHFTNDCSKAMLSPNANEFKLIVFGQNRMETIHLDGIFPVMHGAYGEDGTIQGYIQLSNIPLIGCGVLASSLCMDKYRSHLLVEEAGIKCAKGCVFTQRDKQKIKEFCNTMGYPCFIKPLRAGSSFGITKVESPLNLDEAINLAFEYDHELLIEEFIDGFEVGCAIMGTQHLVVGEVDEIELSDGFFNYEEKYTLKSSKIHVPARINEKKAEEVKELSKKIYKILGCSGFARVDCFINTKGEVIFNEVNTIPGFTSHSRFPTMLKHVGYSFKEIITTIIEGALTNENN